ncbi:MAG: hypothetical protein EA412_09395 [Chitinophagaceae bacterium]|nr:MAG: hypothetical protein EA412_09395 [Chitinophagaceae bacterium]
MDKNFTLENQLIRYIYGETDNAENADIQSFLSEDWSLNETHQGFKDVYTLLNSIPSKSPSRTSVNIILEYSRKVRQPETTF